MRKLLYRALLVVVSLLVGLLAVEGGVRLGAYDPLVSQRGLLGAETKRGDCVQPAPYMGYQLVPGGCGANSLGFKDTEPTATKPAGSKRVLVLGDSITEQRAYVDMLELMLNQQLEVLVDVWNMGVTGYSVLNELELLRHRALDLEPDLVVLQLCLNDFGVTPVLFEFEGDLFWLRASTGSMDRLGLWLFERSALARLIKLRTASGTMAGIGNAEHEAAVAAALVEMQRLCQQRGIPFEVVLFPTLAAREQWATSEEWTYTRFLELAAAHDIPLTDLTPRMLGGAVDDLLRYRGDPVFAELDAKLAAWEVAPSAAVLIRGMDLRLIGVGKGIQPHQYQDTTHPNFLGHYLAAEALTEKLAPQLEPTP